KFSGSTGERLWFTTIDGTEFGAQDLASAVTVDGAGTIAAAGTTVNRREMTGYDFTVARFSDRISGKKMALSGDGSTRTLSVSSRDPLILASGHGVPRTRPSAAQCWSSATRRPPRRPRSCSPLQTGAGTHRGCSQE